MELPNKQTEMNSIKLIRGQRGGYGWEIKLVGLDDKEVFDRTVALDKQLVSQYCEIKLEDGNSEK